MKNKIFNCKKNKRGWIRIVEAMVTILLIIGFVMLILDKGEEKEDFDSGIYLSERIILKEIQLNNSFRDYILSLDSPTEFESFPKYFQDHITSRIPEYLNCTAKICSFDEDCDIETTLKENIYVQSILISANANTYNPNQLKLFCWEKD